MELEQSIEIQDILDVSETSGGDNPDAKSNRDEEVLSQKEAIEDHEKQEEESQRVSVQIEEEGNVPRASQLSSLPGTKDEEERLSFEAMTPKLSLLSHRTSVDEEEDKRSVPSQKKSVQSRRTTLDEEVTPVSPTERMSTQLTEQDRLSHPEGLLQTEKAGSEQLEQPSDEAGVQRGSEAEAPIQRASEDEAAKESEDEAAKQRISEDRVSEAETAIQRASEAEAAIQRTSEAESTAQRVSEVQRASEAEPSIQRASEVEVALQGVSEEETAIQRASEEEATVPRPSEDEAAIQGASEDEAAVQRASIIEAKPSITSEQPELEEHKRSTICSGGHQPVGQITTMEDINNLINDRSTLICWCIKMGLIVDTQTCPNCNGPTNWEVQMDRRLYWVCTSKDPSCQNTCIKGRIPFNCQGLTINKMARLLYMVYNQESIDDALSEMKLQREDYESFENTLREACIYACKKASGSIGGENIRVSIEVGPRMGRNKADQVVIGGIEEGDNGKIYFGQIPPDKSLNQVMKHLKRKILPDSIVNSNTADRALIEGLGWSYSDNWTLKHNSGCLAEDLWLQHLIGSESPFEMLAQTVSEYFHYHRSKHL